MAATTDQEPDLASLEKMETLPLTSSGTKS